MHSLLLLINWKRVHIWAMTNMPCIKRNTTFNLENPSKPKTEIIESKTQAARKKIVWDGKNEYCPLFWQGPAPWLEEDGGPSHPRPPSHRHPHPPPHPRLGHFQDRWSLFDNLGLRHVFWHTKLDTCRSAGNEGRPASEWRSQGNPPKIQHCHCQVKHNAQS